MLSLCSHRYSCRLTSQFNFARMYGNKGLLLRVPRSFLTRFSWIWGYFVVATEPEVYKGQGFCRPVFLSMTKNGNCWLNKFLGKSLPSFSFSSICLWMNCNLKYLNYITNQVSNWKKKSSFPCPKLDQAAINANYEAGWDIGDHSC